MIFQVLDQIDKRIYPPFPSYDHSPFPGEVEGYEYNFSRRSG